MRKYALPSAWFLALWLSGCGGGGNGGGLAFDTFNDPPADAPASPTASTPAQPDAGQAPAPGQANAPVTGTLISADNAVLLTRSTLDIVAKLVSAGRLVTAMVRDGASLIVADGTRSGATVNASACQGAAAGSAGSANRITFAVFQPGHFLPPGKNLNGSFVRCASGAVVLSGFMDLSALQVTGDPSAAMGDWQVSGILSFSGLVFHNADGTETFFTNKLRYRVEQSNRVLTTTLDIESMNAEHVLDDQTHVNYLLEPFYVQTIADDAAGRYTLLIVPGPATGASIINRYTTRYRPDGQGGMNWQSIGDDIELRVDTAGNPPTWAVSRPDLYSEAPMAGELLLSDRIGSHSITATLDNSQGSGVVILHVDEGATVSSQFADWQTLVSTP